MAILYLMAYWYTYSKWYILSAWFVTHLLNVAFKKLWLSPLLINAFSLGVLIFGLYIHMIKTQQIGVSVLNIYLPVVFSSILMNSVIGLYGYIKQKVKNR